MRSVLPLFRTIFATNTSSQMATPGKQPFCSATLAPTVQHDVKEKKWVLPIEGHQAELLYRLQGKTIHLDHTEVPEELGGRGLGKILAKVAFEYIAAQDLKMKVHCDFLQHYLEKYAPEFKKYQV